MGSDCISSRSLLSFLLYLARWPIKQLLFVLAIIATSSNQNIAKNEFSADLLQKLPSRISPDSPVYCKPLRQQKKCKDSLPQVPGFCADFCLFCSCILVRIIYT